MNFSVYYNYDLEKNIPYRIEISIASEISAVNRHEKFLSKKTETNFRHGVVVLVKTAGGRSSGRGFSHLHPTSSSTTKKTLFEEETINLTPTQTT